jgi:branched-chain amino acid transport system ATP-binding protein
MSEPILCLRGLTKRFGGLAATDRLDLDVMPGECHAIIGPNGAGKTTLISQICGDVVQDGGTIRLDGHDIGALSPQARVRRGMARTFQIVQLLPDFTALENVLLAVQAQHGHSFRFIADARQNVALRKRTWSHLLTVGLAERSDVLIKALSNGEQKQVELAVALATKPRLLLLDEPMAGLGHVESDEMVEILQSLKGHVTIVLVEHDMDAVFALADKISVLVSGRIIATGTVDEIRNNADVRTAYLGEGDV